MVVEGNDDGGEKDHLSQLDKIIIKTDILLKPTSESLTDHIMKLQARLKESNCSTYKEKTTLHKNESSVVNQKILEILEDFQLDLSFLQSNMPNELSCFSSSVEWDIHLLKTECVTFLCGIPGELKCSECQKKFRNVHKKIVHQIKTHLSKDVQPYSCEFCHQVIEIPIILSIPSRVCKN